MQAIKSTVTHSETLHFTEPLESVLQAFVPASERKEAEDWDIFVEGTEVHFTRRITTTIETLADGTMKPARRFEHDPEERCITVKGAREMLESAFISKFDALIGAQQAKSAEPKP